MKKIDINRSIDLTDESIMLIYSEILYFSSQILQRDKTKRSIVFLRQRKHVNVCDCSDQSLADTTMFGWNHFSQQDGSFIYTPLVTAFVSEWRRDVQA